MDFTGKTAIVTGSSRGIGKTIAESYAKLGAFVCIIDLDKKEIDNVIAGFKQKGYQCAGYEVNVTDNTAVKTVIKSIYKERGGIDILVNNAGITRDQLVLRMKESDWDAVINVNLKGTFNCIQAASKYMMKQENSSIINIASVIGLMGNAGQANYAASKAGIIGLTKSVAKEFAVRNLRCNAIAPGFIETAMTGTLPAEIVKGYSAAIPMKRMGTTQDVADICIFLASDLSSYVTGQVINVDGGLVM